MNMEDDTPVPPPVAPPADPPAPPPPPDPPPDPDEVGAIDVQGGKHVPLEALKQVRAELKAAKEAAAQLPQLQQAYAQMQGRVATFEQLQQQLQRPPAPPANADADPDLIELARSLDFYQADGLAPDIHRAAKHAALIQKQAQKIATAAVAPLQQQNAQTRSASNYQAALQIQSPQGVKPQKATLDWMWQNLPAEYTADPRVAQALPALALGLEALQGTGSRLPPQPPPPAGPPLHTEGVAGGPARRMTISEAERDVITARGMSEEKYQKLTKNYTPGRATQLED